MKETKKTQAKKERQIHKENKKARKIQQNEKK
jgi:hypothetical protein